MGKFTFVTILCCLRKAHYKGHQFLTTKDTQMLKRSPNLLHIPTVPQHQPFKSLGLRLISQGSQSESVFDMHILVLLCVRRT